MDQGRDVSVHNLSGDRAASAAAQSLLPILPANTSITYLNEGAANVVYRIAPKFTTPPPSIIESYGDGTPPTTEIEELMHSNAESSIFDTTEKLLRLRKDLPTTVPCLNSQEAWQRLIEPLFSPEQLVHQTLVQLRPGNWIERLNEELLKSEDNLSVEDSSSLNPMDQRPAHRHRVYLANDDYGLLITDMTPRSTEDIIVEFKPKWLTQSPSAPENSKRCRTCANIARINAERARKGEKPRKSFCPFDLISSDPQTLFEVAKVLVHSDSSQTNTAHTLASCFAQWLEENKLLPRLRDLQNSLDTLGTLKADVTDENFRVAMTLRDVTVYIRLPGDPFKDRSDIEARIGDLDVKSKDKEAYWKNLERQLIEEGWYEGTEISEDAQPLACSIVRADRTHVD